MTKEFIIKVAPEDAGRRLDIYLAEYSKLNKLGLSRETIQKLITDSKVSIEGVTPLKRHYKIRLDEEIRISFEEKKEIVPQAEEIPLEVIYDDLDLAVINKQAGLVVHPAPGNYEHTLVNALINRFGALSDINPLRPGIVHRLDKETSGVMVVAKNNPAHLFLAEQFAEHSIKRKYVALVKGRTEFDEDVIELEIGRHPYKRQSMAVGIGKDLRYAKTTYRTLKRSGDYSLLELEPFTGRTHQLRVHLSFLGHCILGDTKYGKNNEFPRLALHAKYLGFIHPTSQKFMEFSSPVPGEFMEFIEKAVKVSK